MLSRHQKKVKPITPKQRKILEFIFRFIEIRGFSPTLKDISEEFSHSLSTSQHYVEELEKRGYLRKVKNKTRAIMPVDESSVTIMKLGFISAGSPIKTTEAPDAILVPKNMVSKQGQYYALEVKGDSMVDEGIWDGDVIIIKHQFTGKNNDTVVAITEDGATLKVLKFKNRKPYLQPRNPKYKPIFPKQLEIRGVFCGLIRNNNLQK